MSESDLELDRPWRHDFQVCEFLSEDELLIGGPTRYVVRSVPGGERIRDWPIAADATSTFRSARPPVLAAGRDRVLLEPPRPMGLALVKADAPMAVAARLLVCDLDGRVLVALEGSHLHHPRAFGRDTVFGWEGGRLARWDAATGKRLPVLDGPNASACVSPNGDWIAFVAGEPEDGEIAVVHSRTGALRWKQSLEADDGDAMLAFVDDDRLLVATSAGANSEAVLFDGAGVAMKTLQLPGATEDILIRRDRAALLLPDSENEDRQRAVVVDGRTLEIVHDEVIGRLIALSPSGARAVLSVDEESVATVDTRAWFDADSPAPARRARERRPTSASVCQWFFALPKSVTERELLRLGAAVHHMLDDPLQDFCVLVQPENTVRQLRWFAFVARWRENPYEYFPFVDTLADAASLLVSVLHSDTPRGPLLNAAAYVDHRRTPALEITTSGGKTTVRHGSLPTPAGEGESAPAIVLRQFAPDELPDAPYLSVLEGPAFRYRDRGVLRPDPVDASFVARLVPQIDMDGWMTDG